MQTWEVRNSVLNIVPEETIPKLELADSLPCTPEPDYRSSGPTRNLTETYPGLNPGDPTVRESNGTMVIEYAPPPANRTFDTNTTDTSNLASPGGDMTDVIMRGGSNETYTNIGLPPSPPANSDVVNGTSQPGFTDWTKPGVGGNPDDPASKPNRFGRGLRGRS
ncbi:MAG: hypothetical protein Q9209_007333 [Squamulea sp. 1 TL-2023]